jgi:hypothetical protein
MNKNSLKNKKDIELQKLLTQAKETQLLNPHITKEYSIHKNDSYHDKLVKGMLATMDELQKEERLQDEDNLAIANYSKCCEHHCDSSEYQLLHHPQPLKFKDLPDLQKAIEMLLWYVPCIDSMQSSSINNKIITDKETGDLIFDHIIKKAGLEENDVLWLNLPIPNDLWNEYHPAQFDNKRTCINCQKMIFTKEYEKESKTAAMLRSIRNSIAHGNFVILDNKLLLGFDESKNRTFTHVPAKTGIFKIDPTVLYKILTNLTDAITTEKIYSFAFENLGYNVLPKREFDDFKTKKEHTYNFDMVISKPGANKLYAIAVRGQKHNKKIGLKAFKQIVEEFDTIECTDYVPVIIMESVKLDPPEWKIVKDKNYKVLDLDSINKLLTGTDISSLIDEIQ